MPRKLRPGKARRVDAVDVSDALFTYLTWRDWDAAMKKADGAHSKWELFDGIGPHGHELAWRAIVEEALDAWTGTYPGTRPQSWWLWSAPELRHVSGRFKAVQGHGRCQASGVPYGEPADWQDLPMVETTPAYLDRLDLWRDGERERVAPEAFDPSPFSWALTVSPHDAPDDEDAA